MANPVKPKENFADKWAENPEKEKKFFAWLKKARRDFGLYLSVAYNEVPLELQKALSKNTFKKVLPMIILPAPAVTSPESVSRVEAENIIDIGKVTRPWCR